MFERHVSDADVVALADGELTAVRASEVREHLGACWSCRARARELEVVIGEFVAARQAMIGPAVPPADGPRALLTARLAAEPAPPASLRARLATLAGVAPGATQRRATSLAAAAFVLIVLTAVAAVVDWRSPVVQLQAQVSPSADLTPGAAVLASREAVCSQQLDEEPPRVSRAVALSVFRTYGIADPQPQAYELDYLVAPELGGSTDVRNLWPQSYAGPWNARLKDALEHRLRALVCEGAVDLRTAQTEIAADWIAAYKKYFATDTPLAAHRTFLKDQPWR